MTQNIAYKPMVQVRAEEFKSQVETLQHRY